MENIHITERIKELCKKNNISISTLLNECNVNKNFIYDLERKKTSPSADKLIKIADYFNCPVDYLLGRIDAPQVLNTGDINNNSGVIGQTNAPVTINQQTAFTLQEQDLLRIYNSADGKTQTKIMTAVYDIEEEYKKARTDTNSD